MRSHLPRLQHPPGITERLSRRRFVRDAALMAGVATTSIGTSLFAGPFSEYADHDAIGLAELVRQKQVKPEELLEAAIQRVEATHPELNAVVIKMYDEASRAGLFTEDFPRGHSLVFPSS